MKLLITLCLASQFLFAGTKPVPYGSPKVFEGPEGEVVTMLEVNEGKEVLLHFKGVKGDLDGQTRLYQVNVPSYGKQEFYYSVKKGSKTRDITIMEGGEGQWRFLQPGTPGGWISMKYSKVESPKVSKETILNNYKP